MEKLELRFVDAELSSTEDGLRVSGYVNKTNQWSETLGVRKKFVERILPGTFNRALQAGNEVHFYAEHDPSKILASTRNGSLSLREDEAGLYMEAEIAPTSWGQDYHTLIKTGIIRNMSFGMKVLKDSWRKLENGMYERSISDMYLAEVSAVRNPAYAQSTIAARSIEVLEDIEPHDVEGEQIENQNEERKESNQMNMDIETRDKLAEVLDKILVALEQNQSVQEVVKEAEEVADAVADGAKEVVDEVVEAVDEVVDKTQEKVEEVVDKTQEITKEVVEEAKEVVDATKEAVKEVVEDVVEVVTEQVTETVVADNPDDKPAPDLSEFYKKLLDF